jgi:hypothetical protein
MLWMLLAFVSGLHRVESQPHFQRKAWIRKAFSSCNHTAIFEKCIPRKLADCDAVGNHPGTSGGIIPHNMRVLERTMQL